MNPGYWAKIETIFHAVLTKPPSERDRYLDSACGNDAFLRREIESLLFHHDNPIEQLQTTQTARQVLQPGDQFGSYEIEVRLGGGGMGEVYRARDSRLHRNVALKIIATPLDRPSDIARFFSEAQAFGRAAVSGNGVDRRGDVAGAA
jgi:serine/threonine protein kinase